MKPVIDPEFQALCPPLSGEELRLLEESLVEDGCRDPLVVWASKDLLLDGHNRLSLCTKHGIDFNVAQVGLPDRLAAKRWIARHQLGRRNLKPFQRVELVAHLEADVRAAARERQGTRTDILSNSTGSSYATARDEMAALADVGANTYDKAKQLIEGAGDDLKTKLRAGEISIHKAHQELRATERTEKRQTRRAGNRNLVKAAPSLATALEQGARFATILADPPWAFDDGEDDDQAEGLFGRGHPTYATMTVAEIEALPVADHADEDCHLYLWTTNRNLRAAFEIVDGWGFTYATTVTWAKPHFGMGYWFRGQTEHCLFATKGSQPLLRRDVGTLFSAARGPKGHSSKPPGFYDLVESCSPGPYLELFARSDREDWSQWGAEAPEAGEAA